MKSTEKQGQSRSDAWAFAIASVELEGLEFPDCARSLVQRYTSGDLSSEQLTSALHEMCGIAAP